VHGELAAGEAGVIYVVSGDDIVVFDSETTSTSGSTNPTYLKTWTGFTGIEDVVYKNGEMYVAESGGTVRRFASSLAGGNVTGYSTTWTGLGSGISSMDFDGIDTVVLARNNLVEIFHPSELPLGGTPTLTSWVYSGVYVVAIDDSSNIYAAAYADHTIRQWNSSDTAPTPVYTREWTGVSSAFTNNIRYADGYVYVGQKSVGASGDWYRLHENTPSGDISSDPARQSIAGDTDPEGVIADADGNVYAANWSASTVRKFIIPQNLGDLTYGGKDVHIALPSNTSITAYSVAAQTEDDGAYSYPLGLVGFTFMTESVGDAVTVDVYFETNLLPSDVTPRKFDSVGGSYSDLANPDMEVVSTTWNGKPALRLTYSLIDGGMGDEDGVADGIIVDPIGLGVTTTPATVTTGAATMITQTSAAISGIMELRNDIAFGDIQSEHDVNDYGLYIFTTHSTSQPLDWFNDIWTTAQPADFVQDAGDPSLYTFTNYLTGLTCGTTYYYQNSWEHYTSVSDDWGWSSNPGSSFTTAACNDTLSGPGAPNTGLLRTNMLVSVLAIGAGLILGGAMLIYFLRLRKSTK
jgi:hypothetical protein